MLLLLPMSVFFFYFDCSSPCVLTSYSLAEPLRGTSPCSPLCGAGVCSPCYDQGLVQQARASRLAGQDFPDAAGPGSWSSFRSRQCSQGTRLLKGRWKKGMGFCFLPRVASGFSTDSHRQSPGGSQEIFFLCLTAARCQQLQH